MFSSNDNSSTTESESADSKVSTSEELKNIEEAKVVESANEVNIKKESSKETIPDFKEIAKSLGLPEGVTEEPQTDEHMHCSIIKNNFKMLKEYFPVSNDSGEFLKNVPLELEVKNYLAAEINLNNLDEQARQQYLDEVIDLTKRYKTAVDNTENVSKGIIAKYRIRKGMLFNLIQKIVKKQFLKMPWKYWYRENFNSKSFRSMEDSMGLAKIPNIIRYAFLGIERLKEVKRALPRNSTSDDPVGDFLGNDFTFEDFENDESFKSFIKEVDRKVAMAKIKIAEVRNDLDLGVDEEKIKYIIDQGDKVDPALIRDLIILKKGDCDINAHLDQICDGEEIVVPFAIESDKNLQSIVKQAALLKATIDYINDNDVIDQIEAEHIISLEELIQKLRSLVEARNN